MQLFCSTVGGCNWFGGWGGVLMIIFMIVMAFVAFSFCKKIGMHNCLSCEKKPLEHLQERYAKGEITEEQFMQMKKHLE